MIKEKQLVPGRVLLQLGQKRVERPWLNGTTHLVWEDWWRPCMVVAYYPDIKRRHARKTAPVEGWEVVVLWYGGTRFEQVRIQPDHEGWKAASF